MMDNLYEMMQRDFNFGNNDANDFNNSNSSNNHSRHSRSLVRKISDHNGVNNQHQSHQQLVNDNNEGSQSNSVRLQKQLSRAPSSDISYDTDGAVGASKHRHPNSSNENGNFFSPKLISRRVLTQGAKPVQVSALKHRFSQLPPLGHTGSLNIGKSHNDKDDDDLSHHRRPRLSHRIHAPTSTTSHSMRSVRSVESIQHGILKPSVTPASPLRLVFMRHAERANQALGADWFSKAFRTNSYKAFDENLPIVLPKRRFEQAYEFDVPLTVRGLKSARVSGDAMMRNKLVIDMCISSVALRCIQTCERILTGMESRDRVPIRIEPGLFECPHFNPKIVDSFMTKKELMDNKYNIKVEYKPIISKVNVPETLEDYFERSATVIRGILERYGNQSGTILIVTHAPGLLALTDALKNVRTNPETFYRTVAAYPPLAMHTAEYDGSKWTCTEYPYNIAPIG